MDACFHCFCINKCSIYINIYRCCISKEKGRGKEGGKEVCDRRDGVDGCEGDGGGGDGHHFVTCLFHPIQKFLSLFVSKRRTISFVFLGRSFSSMVSVVKFSRRFGFCCCYC